MKSDCSYYRNQRVELIQHFSKGDNQVLEIGCAEGLFGEYLKHHGFAKRVVGIELFPDAAKVAETRLDRVICGNIESIYDSLNMEEDSFDVIVCGDVLEHLRDPWVILSWLATLLQPGGKLIVSIPNVRHWSVVFPLFFKGEWTYRPQGIMDQTHLRFFTRKSAIALVQQSGLEVEACDPILYRNLDKAISYVGLTGISATQWLIAGRKAG